MSGSVEKARVSSLFRDYTPMYTSERIANFGMEALTFVQNYQTSQKWIRIHKLNGVLFGFLFLWK